MSAHPNNHPGLAGNNPDYYADTPSVAGAPPSELSGGTPPRTPVADHQAQTQPPQFQETSYHATSSAHQRTDPRAEETARELLLDNGIDPNSLTPAQFENIKNMSDDERVTAIVEFSSHHQQQQQYQEHNKGHSDDFPPPPPGPPPNQKQDYHPLQSHPYEPTPPGYSEAPGFSFQADEKPPTLPPRPSQEQVPYYPPPPGEAQMQGAVPLYDQQQQFGGYAAAGPSGVAVSDHVTDSKKKKTFSERFYDWSVKAAVPINKVTNRLGSEAFWPTTLDKECDKAARILKSFCTDGFYTTTSNHPPPSPGSANNPGPNPNSKSKTLVKVPAQAIKQAKGLAIFTTFRTGLHLSGASGSGIVLARLPDGSWSPPSGFLVHTLGAGFMVGLDIYDCVCVLNTDEAVRAFTKPRFSLGGEVSVVAGPVGAGKSLDSALGAGKPVWSYMKSRGFYAGVQADGTVIIQRPDANAAFYGEQKLSPERILRGEVNNTGGMAHDGKNEVVMWPAGARQLIEVLKSVEGKPADERVVGEVGNGPTPGDLAETEGVGKEKEAEMHGGVRYT